jgi:hypothetical protein
MAFQYNGSPISIDRPFTAPDGTKYANLRNPAIREALGVTEVADPPYFDQRFYWGVDNPKLLDDREESDENGDPMWVKVLGEVDGEPAMVDSDERLVTKGLKSQWIAQVKETAGRCWPPLTGTSSALPSARCPCLSRWHCGVLPWWQRLTGLKRPLLRVKMWRH